MNKKKKAIPEKLLPTITGETESTIKYFDALIDCVDITNRSYSYNNVETVSVQFVRLFRDDDVFNEDDEVVLADEDFFYFNYEIEANPSVGSLYSQLLTAVFHDKEMPTEDFSPKMLRTSVDKMLVVRLVIENGMFLKEIQPFTDKMTDNMQAYNTRWLNTRLEHID